jgi:hypothetical protein
VRIEGPDTLGLSVHFAARIIGKIKKSEIWLSDRAKMDIDDLHARSHVHLKWKPHHRVKMKGLPDTCTLWSLDPE